VSFCLRGVDLWPFGSADGIGGMREPFDYTSVMSLYDGVKKVGSGLVYVCDHCVSFSCVLSLSVCRCAFETQQQMKRDDVAA